MDSGQFLFFWFFCIIVLIILVIRFYNDAKRDGDVIETRPAAPKFRNNVAMIRTEFETQSRSTTNLPTSMPVLPYGWSPSGSNSHLYQPVSSECPYPPQAYPAQMPYPLNTQNSNSSPRAGRIHATAPYPSSENTNSNLSSGSNVHQPSAPYPISKTVEEMDSPPNFEEAIKMCPKK